MRFWSSLLNGNLISSRYTLAVGAQALVSGFHFVLNLVLVRQISPYDYGTFAFAFVLAMFAQAINNALISTPLTVYTPVIKEAAQRESQERMLGFANLLFTALLLLAGLLYIPFASLTPEIVMAVATFVGIYSARQFSRSFGYARLRPLVTATGDVSYMFVGSIIMMVLFTTIDTIEVTHILLALAAANSIAIVIENLLLHGSGAFKVVKRSLKGYSHIWLQSKWALVGAVTTLLMGQAHSLVIVQSYGPEAFAPLAAGAVLFGPVRVALMTWQNMVKPEMAIALDEKRAHDVRQQLLTTCGLMAAAMVGVGIVLLVAWPLIHEFLYARKYADQPMALIVMLWAIITICSASYTPPAAALQAFKDFKVLAMASVYAAVISGVSVMVLLYFLAPAWTLVGILIAEMFMLLYLARVIVRKLERLT